MSNADIEEDIVSRAWAKLYNAPEHAERERLKARVIELEAENRKLAEAVSEREATTFRLCDIAKGLILALEERNSELADAFVDAVADAAYWKRQAKESAAEVSRLKPLAEEKKTP